MSLPAERRGALVLFSHCEALKVFFMSVVALLCLQGVTVLMRNNILGCYHGGQMFIWQPVRGQ